MKKIFWLFLVFTIIIGCYSFVQKHQSKEDRVLRESIEHFKTLKNEKKTKYYKVRELNSPYGVEGEKIYVYKSVNGDREEMSSFEVAIKGKNFKLNYFKKFFLDSTNLHFLKKNNDIDTLYYYRINKLNGRRDFVVGKYNYFFENLKLSKKETKLYFQNKDSLKKVRGDVKLFRGM